MRSLVSAVRGRPVDPTRFPRLSMEARCRAGGGILRGDRAREAVDAGRYRIRSGDATLSRALLAPPRPSLRASDPSMKNPPKLSWLGLLLVSVLALCFPELRGALGLEVGGESSTATLERPAARAARGVVAAGVDVSIGFRSERALDEHFEKHGGEFGRVSRSEYLLLAQTLRDAPVGGDVVQSTRSDGVVTRFDRASGAFLAFNGDRTIRTFFKPDDGFAYFQRQLAREGEGR